MTHPRFTLYYTCDSSLTYLPQDKEETALKYIAIRYIERKEAPVLVVSPAGNCFDQPLTERHMDSLRDWLYETYPQYRRESNRIHLLEKMNLSINQQHA